MRRKKEGKPFFGKRFPFSFAPAIEYVGNSYGIVAIQMAIRLFSDEPHE